MHEFYELGPWILGVSQATAARCYLIVAVVIHQLQLPQLLIILWQLALPGQDAPPQRARADTSAHWGKCFSCSRSCGGIHAAHAGRCRCRV